MKTLGRCERCGMSGYCTLFDDAWVCRDCMSELKRAVSLVQDVDKQACDSLRALERFREEECPHG